MTAMTFVLLLLGLVVLTIGAEFLVRGASRLALALGISPLIIGLTIVALGTSAPEIAVSIQSAASGQTDLSLGNVVGSNIFNVLLILGLAAVVAPLIVNAQLIRLDVPVMIAISVLAYVLSLDGLISRIDGFVLLGCSVIYTLFLIRQSRKDAKAAREAAIESGSDAAPPPSRNLGSNLSFIVVGCVGLVLGANWFLSGAIQVAQYFGLSELIIGLTLVAGGTSLPEVATSVMASLRGERDIAVGNVVGSNIANVLNVLGIASVISPIGIPVSSGALEFDLPIMLAVSFACLPIFFTGHRIERWEGGLFLAYYCAYTAYLILDAQQHDALPAFSNIMWSYVLPLTIVTLAIGVVRAWKKKPSLSQRIAT